MYLIQAKMTKHFGTNQLFPLLKYMINIKHLIFHIIPFISPRSYIIPTDTVLKKTVDTHTIILINAIKFYVCLQEI